MAWNAAGAQLGADPVEPELPPVLAVELVADAVEERAAVVDRAVEAELLPLDPRVPELFEVADDLPEVPEARLAPEVLPATALEALALAEAAELAVPEVEAEEAPLAAELDPAVEPERLEAEVEPALDDPVAPDERVALALDAALEEELAATDDWAADPVALAEALLEVDVDSAEDDAVEALEAAGPTVELELFAAALVAALAVVAAELELLEDAPLPEHAVEPAHNTDNTAAVKPMRFMKAS